MRQKPASYSLPQREISVRLTTKEKDNSFQTLAENMPDVICRFSKQFSHLYVNPAITKFTGIKKEQFIGRTPHDVMSKEFADFWVMHLQAVFSAKESLTIEFTAPSDEGERHFQSLLVPEFDEKGNVTTVLSISRDVTLYKEEEKRKDEFFGIVSHELKTPVTSLKAFAQMLHLRFKKRGDMEHATYMAKMDMQLTRLAHLISDLLDVTRLVGGELQFREERFDFNKLVKEVVADVRPITSHEIVIRGKTTKHLFADRERIGQVLTNLLTNAIKYSPKGKKIIVTVKSQKSDIVCSVRDFGIGIPKKQVDKIFERFYRLEKGTKTDHNGLGLGLYIASQIVRKQGGDITVASEVGKGSTFIFTLPYRQKQIKV